MHCFYICSREYARFTESMKAAEWDSLWKEECKRENVIHQTRRRKKGNRECACWWGNKGPKAEYGRSTGWLSLPEIKSKGYREPRILPCVCARNNESNFLLCRIDLLWYLDFSRVSLKHLKVSVTSTGTQTSSLAWLYSERKKKQTEGWNAAASQQLVAKDFLIQRISWSQTKAAKFKVPRFAAGVSTFRSIFCGIFESSLKKKKT